MIERAMTMIDPTFRSQPAPQRAAIGCIEVEGNPAVIAAARSALVMAEIPVRSVALPSFTRAFAAGLAIIGAETWAAFGHLTHSERLGADVRARLLASRDISPAELAAAEAVRTVFRAEVDEALTRFDVLALPTLPDAPLSLAAATDARVALGSSCLVRPFNLSGHPAITLPITAEGLPAGLQLVGRLGEDEALCSLARTVCNTLGSQPHFRALA